MRGIFLLGWLVLAPPTFAQPKDDPVLAQAKYEEAERFYKLGEYETALTLYRESYLLSGEPELLFNIGQCQRQLKQYEEARKSYKAYLRDVPDSPARVGVEHLIQEVESKISSPETQPQSQPQTQPQSQDVPVLKPAKKLPQKLTPQKLWQESTIAKIGVGLVGVGLLSGGASLFQARQANSPDDILEATQQKRGALAVAFTSDLLWASGLVCVGTGWIIQKQQLLPSRAALRFDSSGVVAAFSWEY